MTYLRIRNFWEYQNADAWKKAMASKRQEPPAWCKLYRRRDIELDRLPVETRLLFHELLKLATANLNVMSNDSEWIASEVRMEVEQVSEGIQVLLKHRWLTETQSKRPSRNFLETISPKEVRTKTEIKKNGSPSAGKVKCPECELGGGRHLADCSKRLRVA